MNAGRISISGSLRWVGISQAGRIALQLVGVIVLARLLSPADYGLMAMAATVTALAGLLRDMGTGAALVQKHGLDAALVDAVFWFNVLLGGTLMLLAMIAAPFAARLFHDPRLVPVLLWLSPVFLVESFSIAQRSLLERASSFRELAIIELTSAVLALAAALVLAWRGAGVYALVAQSGVSAAVLALLLWYVSGWRPRWRIRLAALHEVSSFSGNLFAFNLANYLHRNADSMLIGRYLGSSDLGVYNLAYRMLLFPLQNMTFVVSRVMLPAYSREQMDHTGIADHYARTLRGIALVTAPLMGLLWALREPFVLLMFEARWLPAADVIAWLAPVGFLQSIISTSGSVLVATGNARTLRNLGFVGVPLILLAFVVGLRWGVVGVAMAYCIANLLWIFPVLEVTLAAVGRSARSVLSAWSLPLLLAVACAVPLRIVLMTCLEAASPALQLVLGIALGCLGYGLGAWLCFRRSVLELLSKLHRPYGASS